MYPTVSNVFTATTFEIRKKEMRNDVHILKWRILPHTVFSLEYERSLNFESKLSSCQFFKKQRNEFIFYNYATCFRSFFGRHWRLKKGISKLSDLYLPLNSFCCQNLLMINSFLLKNKEGHFNTQCVLRGPILRRKKC